MWWWRKKQEVRVIHPEIHESFGRVRQDTTALFQWVDYLYRLSLSQHNIIASLKTQTAAMHTIVEELRSHSVSHKALLTELHSKVVSPKVQPHEIKAVIDEHYSVDHIHTRLHAVEEKLAQLHNLQASRPQHDSSSLQTLNIQTMPHSSASSLQTTPLKEKILRRISRNSKEYIKSVMRSMIFKYGRISAIQLRDMVVEEQGLCSRSSFYRILDEVETDEGVICEQSGKEKEYFADPKTIKTQT